MPTYKNCSSQLKWTILVFVLNLHWSEHSIKVQVMTLKFTRHALYLTGKISWAYLLVIILSKFPHYWVISLVIKWHRCGNAELRLNRFPEKCISSIDNVYIAILMMALMDVEPGWDSCECICPTGSAIVNKIMSRMYASNIIHPWTLVSLSWTACCELNAVFFLWVDLILYITVGK